MPIADIIVPVFNEADILEEFHQRVCALGLDLSIIYIDNASTDGSIELIESFSGATLIRHSTNEGYGGSLVDGMSHAKNEFVIIIDADCEYPPEAIPDILAQLQQHELIYTSRLLNRSSAIDANMSFLKLVGNKTISYLYNKLFGQSTTDLYTGCKGFRLECIEGASFKRKGFDHVLEFACLLSSRGYKIVDIPVDYAPRHTGNSKMSHLAETISFLYLLLAMYTKLGGRVKTPQDGNE
jgi:glycosyltransferase involved in cell wall biosynthesis